jgi:uncharacterized protein YkwD
VARFFRRSAAESERPSVAPSRCPGARLQNMNFLIVLLLLFQNAKPEIRIPDLERQIHQSVNLQRRSNDRQSLEWDDTLVNLARAHSEDMAKRGYFKHVNPEGETPMKRLQQAGHNNCRLVGENIYQNNLYSRAITEKKRTTYDWNSMETITATTLKGWMDSDSHRENILQNDYTREGVGVAIGSDDKVYITQVFCADTK